MGSSPTGTEAAVVARGTAEVPCGETGAKAAGRGRPQTSLQELGRATRDPSLSPTPHQGAGNGAWVADSLRFPCLFFKHIFKEMGFKIHPK